MQISTENTIPNLFSINKILRIPPMVTDADIKKKVDELRLISQKFDRLIPNEKIDVEYMSQIEAK